MDQETTHQFHTYIMTNATRDRFIMGCTDDLLKTVKQFYQPGYRRNYLPPDRQDCFLLVYKQGWDDEARAVLEKNILENLSPQALKSKITAHNPKWNNRNIELLQQDPGWNGG